MSYILEICASNDSLELLHHCPQVVLILSMCECFMYFSSAVKSAKHISQVRFACMWICLL